MTNMTSEEWMKINQNYLIAEINVIKAKLLVYQDSLTDENALAESTRALEIANTELEHFNKEHSIITRLNTLVELFQLSQFEKKLLLLGIGAELDASLGKLLSNLQGNSGLQMPTFNLALALFSDAHWSAVTPEGPLRYWQIIKLNKSAVLMNSSFMVDELILHYLTGIHAMDRRLSNFVRLVSTTGELVPSHQRIAEQITQYLTQPSEACIRPVIQLQGKSTEDQKAIIAKIFTSHNLTTYYLPVQLLPSDFQELSSLLLHWNREAILNQYVLFIDGKQLNIHDQQTIDFVKHLLENIRGIVIISTEHKFTDSSRVIHSIKVEKPLREEQKLLWAEHLESVKENIDGELGNLVSQFNLDSHSISHLAQLAKMDKHSNEIVSSQGLTVKEKLWISCNDYTRPNLSGLAQRIEPMATWDDLVLPKTQKTILKEICIHVKQRQKVYYEWGFRNKSNRGLGISALFTGESGTGKTMASEVLANALQLDLYRIDLSQVVNKYIGETEKNLKKIFDAAEESGSILLFDEADALFGKRSDVKDSHDRYANIEVSYLLQKMEEYRGLAILTTNMKNALDKAFLRRIRFIIQFPFPDAQMRGEIWKRVFPRQTPSNGLVINKLAKLNIAGGNIRNIALNASFAAAHKDQPVSMLDIHNAARNEYIKLDKQMSPSESLI